MRSISSGGQPCSVESVTLWETCGEMEAMNAASSGNSSVRTLRHSANTGSCEASFMDSM